MKHFDLSRFRQLTRTKRYPGLQGMPEESADRLDRIESEVRLRKDSFALICRPIRKSEVVDTFFHRTIRSTLEQFHTAGRAGNVILISAFTQVGPLVAMIYVWHQSGGR